MKTEVRQSRTLERPATKLVAIACQSEKLTGQGTIDRITDIHEELRVSHPASQQDRHSGSTSEH